MTHILTQEELNKLAIDCRLSFGPRAFNDGVDAMLRAVSKASVHTEEAAAWGMPDAEGNIVDTIAAHEKIADKTQWHTQYKVPLYATPPSTLSALILAVDALSLIARGHHDPTPTRLLYVSDTDAGRCDSWWQMYYTSNDQRNKEIARDAIAIIKRSLK